MKYKLSIRIRKGLEEREIQTEILDLQHFTESIRLREFTIFDKDSYLVFCLDKIEENLTNAS